MSEWIGLTLLFVLVASLVFTFVMIVSLWTQRGSKRLEDFAAEDEAEGKPRLLLGSMTTALETTAAMSEEKRSTLQTELREAGFYRPSALIEYTALRTVLVLLPLFIAAGFALLVGRRYMPIVGLVGLSVAGLGYSLPRVFIIYLGRMRKRQIEQALPVGVDLLALALSGGQNLLSALNRVGTEMQNSFPVLSQELQIVRRQAELRTLGQALNQLADRVNVPEVRTLTLILTQSERLGTDIASALHEFAANFRTHVRQRAEARANRASFWMLFPTLLCLWIPAGLVLIGPVYYQFWYERGNLREILDQSRKGIGELSQPKIGGSQTPTNEP